MPALTTNRGLVIRALAMLNQIHRDKLRWLEDIARLAGAAGDTELKNTVRNKITLAERNLEIARNLSNKITSTQAYNATQAEQILMKLLALV